MFDLRMTSGGIDDDIAVLSEINGRDNGVNEFISSLVIKYIQKYFGVQNIGEGLNLLEERLNMGGGGFDLLNNPINESYTLECLGCVSQTSAIMKEIIFNDRYKHDGIFRSCDLGAGTGILSLGAYISGLRKGLKTGIIYLVDHEKVSLEKGKKILQSLVETSFEVHSILGDIRDPAQFADIGEEKILFWISETIGKTTPYFEIDSDGNLMMDPYDIEHYKMVRAIDPFPEVVWSIINGHNSELKQDVKAGRVALFPDYINKLYIPDGEESSLDLKTSRKGPQKLGDIGSGFEYMKPFDTRKRWM